MRRNNRFAMHGKQEGKIGVTPRGPRLFGWTVRQAPRVPEGVRVFVVGDIHGCYDLLVSLLKRIRLYAETEPRRNILIFLGDYVDRGPQSKAVMDLLTRFHQPDWDVVMLRGNHEQAVLDFLADAQFYRIWREFGAAETLLSYGVKPPRFDDDNFVEVQREFASKCPPEHINFLNTLPYSYVVGDYMFVHAGVRPGIALDRQMPEDLMRIRDDFLLSEERLAKIIVHGHTPVDRPVRNSVRIGIDTGAYATGRLTAAVLEGEDCTFLTESLSNAGTNLAHC